VNFFIFNLPPSILAYADASAGLMAVSAETVKTDRTLAAVRRFGPEF
jgi:hypothetical protein